MDFITITEKDIAEANHYVPLGEKKDFVAYVAPRCFERVEIVTDHKSEDNNVEIPSMYKENSILKSRYLMGAFVKLYLKKDYEPVKDDEWLMSQDDYDRYARVHVFNQIERMKQKGGEVRNIAFDLLQDYHDLEKKLNAEIYGLMQPMNDTVSRLIAYLNDVLSDTVKRATMEQTAEEIESIKDEIKEFKAKRNREGE